MKATAGKAIIEGVRQQGRDRLSEHEAKEVLRAYGIPVTKEAVVANSGELATALREFEWPVVLKIDSPDILHKTEAGLVELNCQNQAEASAAFARLLARAKERFPSATINGVLVQEMVADATECIVGVKQDPQFGLTILFGLGGIFVEVFGDVALRVAPLGESDVERMVTSIKGYKILAGARGHAKADIGAIKEVLHRISDLALDLEEEIAEIDINPLMVRAEGRGAVAVDALMLLSKL